VWAKLVHPAPEKEIQYVRLALITCTAHAAARNEATIASHDEKQRMRATAPPFSRG
jgi:hypothetical protein